ncbi:MAG: hypothetical protein IH840_04130 [Candidatus Heimdallarchaeota archaeon]|nr:hypothetical protein [Candidatus Heimdallarchaeota archaeon]
MREIPRNVLGEIGNSYVEEIREFSFPKREHYPKLKSCDKLKIGHFANLVTEFIPLKLER